MNDAYLILLINVDDGSIAGVSMFSEPTPTLRGNLLPVTLWREKCRAGECYGDAAERLKSYVTADDPVFGWARKIMDSGVTGRHRLVAAMRRWLSHFDPGEINVAIDEALGASDKEFAR